MIRIYETKSFRATAQKSVVTNTSGIDIHIKKILKKFNPAAIKKRKIRVALDCVNGAGSIACCRLLNQMGCRVKSINCDITKPFPHPPEPVPENLAQLIKLVKTSKADIGFALDSDADRLAIVSEEGKPIGEEMTLALAANFMLSKNRKRHAKNKIVVTNLSTSRALDDITRQNHGILIRTKIGEVHVAEELKNLKGLIGGEGNGGVIYPAIGFNRDSLAAMAIILSFMASRRQKISRLREDIPAYFMVKKKIKCQSQDQADELVRAVKEKFRKKDLILTEGVKVVLPQSWVHVRASNTEPVIRIIAEGKDRKEVNNLVKQVLKAAA